MKPNQRYFKVGPGVWGLKILFVNVYVIASDDHWVLVDAGLSGSAWRIIRMVDDLFDGVPPAAILLTHGHFDHRGALNVLLDKWKVPVFAHQFEIPYLSGKSAYPPPDPSVGGGLMSLLSFLYPKRPIDLGTSLQPLPYDGSVPYLPEWQTILVPGHAPGQVAFFRSSDKLLIAGDAFVTTRQESAVATLSALPILSGPPKYFTYDWDAARLSVNRLKDLLPRAAATGHGLPMYGNQLSEGLANLTEHFDEMARPSHGRYVPEPARTDENGVVTVPPSRLAAPVAIIIAVVATTLLIGLRNRKKT